LVNNLNEGGQSMKIIVPIRKVPDPNRPIRVSTTGEIQFIRWIASRADEAAVDEAVRLAGSAGEVVAVSAHEELLLSGLARGAARGLLVDIDEPRAMAAALAEIARREQPDLILMGDDGETGPRTAGILGAGQATSTRVIELIDAGVRVTRELARSREVLELSFPAVLCLHPSFAVPKIVSLYDIVDARGKIVERLSVPHALSGLTVVEATAAPSTRLGRIVTSVDELLTALREEARVI
jgi:electron transfer flavoprotein alpha/beta subunit